MPLTNEVLQCISDRRSSRKFTDKKVSEEELTAVLNAAIWAPSGSNSQSWLFTAVQNENTLTKLNTLVRDAFLTWIPEDDYPAKHAIKEKSKSENYNFFYNAPILIIASNKTNYENASVDCALALENIFLAAHSLKLGSCYINQLYWLRNDKNIRAFLYELGIPKEHTVCSSAAIGHIEKLSNAPLRKQGTINIIK